MPCDVIEPTNKRRSGLRYKISRSTVADKSVASCFFHVTATGGVQFVIHHNINLRLAQQVFYRTGWCWNVLFINKIMVATECTSLVSSKSYILG